MFLVFRVNKIIMRFFPLEECKDFQKSTCSNFKSIIISHLYLQFHVLLPSSCPSPFSPAHVPFLHISVCFCPGISPYFCSSNLHSSTPLSPLPLSFISTGISLFCPPQPLFRYPSLSHPAPYPLRSPPFLIQSPKSSIIVSMPSPWILIFCLNPLLLIFCLTHFFKFSFVSLSISFFCSSLFLFLLPPVEIMLKLKMHVISGKLSYFFFF